MEKMYDVKEEQEKVILVAVSNGSDEYTNESLDELLELAKSKGKNFLFEASVGGGIPIIRPLNQSLTADEIMVQQITY